MNLPKAVDARVERDRSAVHLYVMTDEGVLTWIASALVVVAIDDVHHWTAISHRHQYRRASRKIACRLLSQGMTGRFSDQAPGGVDQDVASVSVHGDAGGCAVLNRAVVHSRTPTSRKTQVGHSFGEQRIHLIGRHATLVGQGCFQHGEFELSLVRHFSVCEVASATPARSIRRTFRSDPCRIGLSYGDSVCAKITRRHLGDANRDPFPRQSVSDEDH
jgi:hypothetical protein